jgi:uncharacterized membrane protein
MGTAGRKAGDVFPFLNTIIQYLKPITMLVILRTYSKLIAGLTLLVGLIAARMLWHSSLHFGFLLWNLFLAVLPLVASHLIRYTRGWMLTGLCAAFWMLFFPNSAYLLTDIVHLRVRGGAAFWLDVVILFGAGMCGIALAMYSLQQMEAWYSKRLPRIVAMGVTVMVLLGSGYGIYLGRVERWNSWDILFDTRDLISTIAYELRHPYRCMEVWLLSLVFASGLGLAYFMIGRNRAAE